LIKIPIKIGDHWW